MLFYAGVRVLRCQSHIPRTASRFVRFPHAGLQPASWIHTTSRLLALRPVILADIGEGIVECEITQWFVEPGARVEEFSPLCEVQSDKASVEITSRFSGVVKKLHYEAGDVAKVGRPIVDIDVKDGPTAPNPDALAESEVQAESSAPDPRVRDYATTSDAAPLPDPPVARPAKGKAAAISTPAVRHLAREYDVDIADVTSTGRDGRVTKEDIQKFVQARDTSAPPGATAPVQSNAPPPQSDVQEETILKLTNTQSQMFRSMTRSLSIPHFLYADEVDFSSLYELRARLNRVLEQGKGQGQAQGQGQLQEQVSKLTYLPFIIKAVSMALKQYPILNARVELDPAGLKDPSVVLRSQHNIGVAVDTPSGLVVPVVRNVGALNIIGIATELSRLQSLALAGKLGPRHLSGGTITVSNIGGIGGTYLSPVIVAREVAILGIGRMRTVPAFTDGDGEGEGEGEGRIIRKRVCNFSWSADHRVVDGATMARASEVVRRIVEEPDVMVMHLR